MWNWILVKLGLRLRWIITPEDGDGRMILVSSRDATSCETVWKFVDGMIDNQNWKCLESPPR